MNVTSVKGILSRPTISVYGNTKFGAENFSDCLRLEMRKFGVKVSIVEPGNFGGLTGIVRDQNVNNQRLHIVITKRLQLKKRKILTLSSPEPKARELF